MYLTSTTKKTVALFFLSEILFNLVLPVASYALTSGTNQPEYTSYEPTNTTDMVNLLTGDFTYNVPLIDVPSPEGGFSLPLSYHSGIGLEDEASWAGLGWNVNAGSISRAKVSSADDDYDNISNVNIQDPGGSGYVKNFLLYQKTWDSEKGFGGAINLLNIVGTSWSNKNGLETGSIMGLTFNKDKAHFNPGQTFSAISAIAGAGAMSAAGAASSPAGMMMTGMNNLQTALNLYSGYKSQGSTAGFAGEWSTTKTSSYLGFRQDYRYWLDNTREEHSYGALYLGQMKNNMSINPSTSYSDDPSKPRIGTPQQSIAAPLFPQAAERSSGTPAITSDMYSYVEPSANWGTSFNPTHVAYDSYAVMGPGIGGRIAPYRPEIGSLIFPKKLNLGSSKINLTPYLEEGKDIDKIQFKYDGEASNTYTYHDTNGPGLSISHAGSNSGGTDTRRVYYNLTDPKLSTAASRVEADRDGLYNKRLAQGKHVAWFSNKEMLDGTPSLSGQIMEYKPLADNLRRTNRGSWPRNGIGGYAITNADGTTYHYSLPVYNYQQEDFSGVAGKETTKFSRVTTTGMYATTWLLTAITGPDFVDRGAIGSVDAEDWGYWVKFDYGRFASNYPWRNPYVGYTHSDDQSVYRNGVLETTGQSSYSKGVRESYYLNSIQTRSHTALFLKDIRQDGRSAYRLTASGATPYWADPTDIKYPASSLSLREIVLLNNNDFQSLQQLGFAKNSAAGAIIDNSQLNPTQQSSSKTCTLEDIYDVYDAQDNATIRSFITQKAQRRILLNTSYELCPSTTNSFASALNPPMLDNGDYSGSRSGKLTLKSISYFGANNVKLFPDFKFQYNGANPKYDMNNWDGWGSYNASGSYSHNASNSDPTAWHLTDIITPLGGRLTVKYESDDYGSISGEPIRQQVPISSYRVTDETHATLNFDLKNIAPYYSLTQLLTNGSNVTLQKLKAEQTRRCWSINGYLDPKTYGYDIPANQQIQNLSYSSFTIQRPATDGGHGNSITGCPQATWSSIAGSLEVTLPSKKGGGVRVASISTRDEANNEYKTGYLYTQTGEAGALTSGVVAQEPDLVKTADYPFYHYYDFPNTPVIYSKVTVVDGMRSDTDYQQKTQYSFNTPTKDCIQVSSTNTIDPLNWGPSGTSPFRNSQLYYFDIKNFAARVGRLESIKVLDNKGLVAGETKLNYTDQLPGNQGKFTTGSNLCELAYGTQPGDDVFFKASRTTVTTYPNVLTSTQTVSNGLKSTQSNLAWDFLTGGVLKASSTTSQGETYVTTTVPAYTKYPELRSKAEQVTNKQMLSQGTASYTQKVNANGAITDVVSAAVQTWKKDWQNYRLFNPAPAVNSYVDETGTPGVWRHHKTYMWNDVRLSATGSTPGSQFRDFKWPDAGNQHKNWQELQEVTLYDHFSQPLETKVNTSQYVSHKRGYNNALPIISAPNARYGEAAYSGAEDLIKATGHFEGEVRGGATRSSDVAHTGSFSSKVPANGQGFLFESSVGSPIGAVAGSSYKASVWLHKSDLTTAGGNLFAKLKDATGNSALISAIYISDPRVKRAGDWYLLDLYFSVPATANGKTLQVGCANDKSGIAYFDDFRFHPLSSTPTTYVYAADTWQKTHELDVNNLYTRFEYDASGRLIKTYREVLNKPQQDVLISESRLNFARNATYAITVANAGSNGSISPSGASTVYLGEDLLINATGATCNSLPSNSFQVDGTTYSSQATLPDGTTITCTPQGYTVSNVHGNHSLQLNFDSAGYPPAGTWTEGSCVTDERGCYTGMVTWYLADGCGGYTTEQRPARSGQCVNQYPSPCDQLQSQ
jgi:hypothetical protein